MATLMLRAVDLWKVKGDEGLKDWAFKSRTLSILGEDGQPRFTQLPSVMRFDKYAQPNTNDWRVNEEWLREDYLRVNNYDGDGQRRCENYLWKDDTALYNNKGFPLRQYLVMSRNLLRGIAVETNKFGSFLKFETLAPGEHSEMPWFRHKFDLVCHNKEGITYHTHMTPKGFVYYYVTSVDGYGFIPIEYVEKV